MLRAAGITMLIISVGAFFGCGSSGSSRLIQTSPPAGTSSPSSAPAISSISPLSAETGSSDVVINITGANFKPIKNHILSWAMWSVNGNDTYLETTFVSSTQLTAVVPAELLKNAVSARVFVETGDPMGAGDGVEYPKSNAVPFNVVQKSSTKSGFTLTGEMVTPRAGHSATLLLNGKVLITGGDFSSAELYDPATGIFQPTGSMGTVRSGSTATLLGNGKVLFVGGFACSKDTCVLQNSAEIYDPDTGEFSETGSMVVARVQPAATLLKDGKVLITGGTIRAGGPGAATSSSEIYDPESGVFERVGSMLSARSQHTATLLADGRVLIVGGWNGHLPDAADDPPWNPLFAEVYDPVSKSFFTTGSMSTTRIGHNAIQLPNQKVLVLGGIPTLQNLHEQPPDPAYAELYDPARGTFSRVGELAISQTGYTATLLPNGAVLIAGGEVASRATDMAELLDASSGTLFATDPLKIPRKGHTATLLRDGSVLVTGGVDEKGFFVARAELYK